MKKIMLIILMILLCACVKEAGTANNSSETLADRSDKNTPINSEDNAYSSWNGTYISPEGDSLTINVSKEGDVECEYFYSDGGGKVFYDNDNIQINENVISIYAGEYDFKIYIEFTLNGNVLHYLSWGLLEGETEKCIYVDNDMYRDGKLPDGTQMSVTVASTQANSTK